LRVEVGLAEPSICAKQQVDRIVDVQELETAAGEHALRISARV